MPNIFISYSSQDREAADFIAENLRKYALDVYIDYERLKGGDEFIEKLGREIDKCDYFILVFSNNSAQSKWVKREFAYAMHQEKTVVPVILEQVTDKAAWFPIVGLHHVDFKFWNIDEYGEKAISQLFAALGMTINITSNMFQEENAFTVGPSEIGFSSGRYNDQVSFKEFENVLGGISLYKSTEGQTSKVWARWTPNISETDGYEIQVFVPKIHSNTRNARYKVNNVRGISSEVIVNIDQSLYSNEWVTLGDYELDKSIIGAGTIFLNDLTGERDGEISFTTIRYKRLFARG